MMIVIGGIIGVGFFVGSSVFIVLVGLVVIFSYGFVGLFVMMVMWMLSEMVVVVFSICFFFEFMCYVLGNWVGFLIGWFYWYFWVVVVVIEVIVGVVIIQGWLL